jgi:hypothetical protein
VVLGIELRALHLLNKCSTTLATHLFPERCIHCPYSRYCENVTFNGTFVITNTLLIQVHIYVDPLVFLCLLSIPESIQYNYTALSDFVFLGSFMTLSQIFYLPVFVCLFFVVLGLEFRAYTLSHSDSPFL